MAIASEVIKKVRQNLVDPDGRRWPDARLLSLLNDALHYVALEGRYNPQQGWIKLVNNQVNYDVSEDAVKLLRFEYDGKEVPFRTPEEMDRLSRGTPANSRLGGSNFRSVGGSGGSWRDTVGTRPQFIVVGLKAIGNFTLYPIIEEVGLNVHITANSRTGLITNLVFAEDAVEIEGSVGDINTNSLLEYLKVIYVEKPSTVTSLDEDDEGSKLPAFVDDTMATILPLYITSQAYKDNQDVENLNQSEIYWRDFQERLSNASITQDGRSTDKVRTTQYRTGANA